jgi:hypothetical protein
MKGTWMRLIVLVLLVSSCLRPSSALAATAPASADAPPITDLATMVVSGAQPGPGMWKVSKGDHVLWILGTLSPLPKKMEWVSGDVEDVIAQAQEVIWAPTTGVQIKAGIFQGLMLMPKLLGARKNSDGQKLQDVVPADMYARWLPLKAKYIGRNGGIEKWRPIFAAMALWDEAIDDAGLTQSGLITPIVQRVVKQHQIKQTAPTSYLVITDAKAALNEFRASRLDDLDCFDKTLQRLDTDLSAMKLRANAWAVGDIDAIRALPYDDQNEACQRAVMQAGVVHKRTDLDLDTELKRKWFEAAEKALTNNRVTFAMLPMAAALKPDGYLAKLQAKGYLVEAP